MQTKTTRAQDGNIGWDHLEGNLSLKKVEAATTENRVKFMSASMMFVERTLRTVKPIPHIPAIIPTIWCLFMSRSPKYDVFLRCVKN